jgi:hypothetical protein
MITSMSSTSCCEKSETTERFEGLEDVFSLNLCRSMSCEDPLVCVSHSLFVEDENAFLLSIELCTRSLVHEACRFQ